MKKYNIKIGDIFTTKYSGDCRVIAYYAWNNITVEFIKTKFKINTTSYRLSIGMVKDPFYPRVFGIGYIGEGEYSQTNNRKLSNLWTNMLSRCYSGRDSAYLNIKVCKKWHNFQNFCEDITKMPNWNEKGFDLDKDWRIIGSKIYSPKSCSFVPKYINYFMKTYYNNYYETLPLGVSKRHGKYIAQIQFKGTHKFLGYFTSAEQAGKMYNKHKTKFAKQLANKYKKVLHKDVYKNLMEI